MGLLTKYTILFFVAGLLVGLLLTPNRRYFCSGWFWCGVGLALVMALPVIVWQFQHHFVALAWMKSIHARDVSGGRADYFIPNQFWNVTNPVTVPIWCGGLWFLFRTKEGKPFRVLGWMYVVPLILFVVAKGRDYYLAPAYPMLMAAGAVWGESWVASKSPRAQRGSTRTTWISLHVAHWPCSFLRFPLRRCSRRGGALPMRPEHRVSAWKLAGPSLLPLWRRCAIPCPRKSAPRSECLAADEGEAGAVNLYGRAYGLHEAISGMNSNWLRGYGTPPPQTVIAVGFKRKKWTRSLLSCEAAARLSNPYGIVNQPSETVMRFMFAVTFACPGRSSGRVFNPMGERRDELTGEFVSTQAKESCNVRVYAENVAVAPRTGLEWPIPIHRRLCLPESALTTRNWPRQSNEELVSHTCASSSRRVRSAARLLPSGRTEAGRKPLHQT